MKNLILIFSMFLISVSVFAYTKPIVIYAFSGTSPMAIGNGQNRYDKGIFIEITNEIFQKRMGMKIVYHVRPWARAQLEVKQGLSDIMITVPTKCRLEYSIKTDYPVLSFYNRIYTYKGNNRLKEINSIKTVSDIKKLGLMPVSYRGNGWHKTHIDDKGIKTHYVNSLENALVFLANKRADIFIASEIFVNYMINKHNLHNFIDITNAKFGPVKMYILISKKSKLVKYIPEINKVLKNLEESGFFDKIKEKYTYVN